MIRDSLVNQLARLDAISRERALTDAEVSQIECLLKKMTDTEADMGIQLGRRMAQQRAYQRQYRQTEAYRQSQRRYYATNAEQRSAAVRDWQRRNSVRVAQMKAARRARQQHEERAQ